MAYRTAVTAAAAVVWWLLGGHFAMLALLAYLWLTAMATTNTSKTVAVEQRVNGLVSEIGSLRSQQGTTSAASNLSQTETGSAQPLGGDVESGIPNNNDTSSPYGATVSGSSVASHYHGMQNHTHNFEHYHYNQVSGDFDNLVTVVNEIRTALIAAGIL